MACEVSNVFLRFISFITAAIRSGIISGLEKECNALDSNTHDKVSKDETMQYAMKIALMKFIKG